MSHSHHKARPGSLRSFLGGVVALLQVRAELLSLEGQELKEQLLGNLLLLAMTLVLALVGLSCVLILVLLLTPAESRALVFGLLSVLLLAGAAGCVLCLRRRLRREGAPFAGTIAELRRDWQSIGGKDGR